MSLTIDSVASTTFSGTYGITPVTLSISTANPLDLILIFVSAPGATSAGVFVTSTTIPNGFVRATANLSGAAPIYEFWTVSSVPLSSETITIGWNGTVTGGVAVAVAISGADIWNSSGFDADPSLPNIGTTDPGTVSTVSAATMVIGAFANDPALAPSPTAGPGFTALYDTPGDAFLLEYQNFSAPQSGLSVTQGTGSGDAISFICDAVTEAPALQSGSVVGGYVALELQAAGSNLATATLIPRRAQWMTITARGPFFGNSPTPLGFSTPPDAQVGDVLEFYLAKGSASMTLYMSSGQTFDYGSGNTTVPGRLRMNEPGNWMPMP